MTDKVITRLLPDGARDGGMKAMGYISADTIAEGTADEKGYLFFTNEAGNVTVSGDFQVSRT